MCVCACNRVVVRVQMFPFQGASTTELPEFKQDLASFLLTRGPHAFIGHSWKGCSKDYPVPAALNADYVKHPRNNPNTLHHFDDICTLFDRLTALFLRGCVAALCVFRAPRPAYARRQRRSPAFSPAIGPTRLPKWTAMRMSARSR